MNLEDIVIKKEPNIIFMGTPDFSVPVLEGLLEKYKVKAVVTQPDKLVGRDQHKESTPVKKCALDHTVLVLQPEKLKEHVDEILALEPDLIVTCAYGQLVPKEILEYPRLGCINVHASLLPKLRGGAPIHHAIMRGFKKTGITIMHMDKSLDTGDIISQREVVITEIDTASTLHDKLSIVGKELLLETLPQILDGTAPRIKQEESEASYAFNIKREDERIDFSVGRKQVYNHIRGLNGWPGAYCLFEGKVLKVWASRTTENYFSNLFNGQITAIYPDGFGVKVENGEVVFIEVQLEGKKRMPAHEFVNGFQNKEDLIGKVLD